MAGISTEVIEDKNTWENFIQSHPEANFLQSWQWGEFHKKLNHPVVRLGFYKNQQLAGVVSMVVEPARRGRHVVTAGGPLLDWQDKAVVDAWIAAAQQTALEHHCIFVRVRPQLLNMPEHHQLFKKLGFRKSPMHVTADLTTQLDLTKTDDELKKQMRKGTRYEVNRAEKVGIKVEVADDDRFMEEFCDLQFKTAERQKFVPFSRKFLTEQFKAFAADKKVLMYRASHEGRLLAMAFVIFYNQEAAYHYGASTELARKLPGAYAAQWEAIKEARHRGCSRYNFWGVTEHGDSKHRFYGVSVFKRGFGGEDVAYLPAHDLVVNKSRYLITYGFETARRKARRL